MMFKAHILNAIVVVTALIGLGCVNSPGWFIVALVVGIGFVAFLSDIEAPACEEGDVFYDGRTNRFFEVRKRHGSVLACGGLCHYYGDSKTTIQTQKLSIGYLRKCVRVRKLNAHPELWKFEGIGWRVLGE